jgi:hypothetical protein
MIVMRAFYKGFIIGYLFKQRFNNFLKNIVFSGLNILHKLKNNIIKDDYNIKDGIHKVNLVVHITNEDLFNEVFNGIFPVWWNYLSEKKVLKTELDDDVVDFLNNIDNINVNELMEYIDINAENLITIDIPLFKTFGKIYLYVTYYKNNKKFINIYDENMDISKDDFNHIKELSMFNNILCASLKCQNKTEYITKYLKLFYNNNINLTPELLLLNYDKINCDLKNSSFLIIRDRYIREYSYTEIIK